MSQEVSRLDVNLLLAVIPGTSVFSQKGDICPAIVDKTAAKGIKRYFKFGLKFKSIRYTASFVI